MSGETLNLSTSDSNAIEVELEFISMFSNMSDYTADIKDILNPSDFYLSFIRTTYEYLLDKYHSQGGFVVEDLLFHINSTYDEETKKLIKQAVKGIASFNHDGLISRAKQIKSYSAYRTVRKISDDIKMCTPETVYDVVSDNLVKLAELTDVSVSDALTSIKNDLADYVQQKYSGKASDIIPIGYSILDSILQLAKGDLLVLAARPAVGKSAFVINLAAKLAFQKKRTIVFSLEMSKMQVYDRLFSCVGQIPHDFLKRNSISGQYSEKLGKASALIYDNFALYIDDNSSVRTSDIKRKATKEKADVIIIDYLQLLKPEGRRKYANKNDDVSEITRDLKILAGELKVPIILLSQLSRDVERRGEKSRPQLSDLRDSGSIEQDANAVVFLSKVTPNDENSDILLDVAKNRSGRTGKIIYQFDRDVQTFRETDKEYQPPSQTRQY